MAVPHYIKLFDVDFLYIVCFVISPITLRHVIPHCVIQCLMLCTASRCILIFAILWWVIGCHNILYMILLLVCFTLFVLYECTLLLLCDSRSSYTVRYRATWYLMRCRHSVMWCGVMRCCITLCQTTPTRPDQTLLRYTVQAVLGLTPINATWSIACDSVRCGSCLPCDHALHLHISMLSHWAVRLYYSALYYIVHPSGP